MIDPKAVRLGRNMPDAGHRAMAPRLRDYLRRPLPKPALALDNTPGVAYGMYRNDAIGDCTCAGLANYYATCAAREGRKVAFTDQEVSAYYFALTGGADTGLVEIDVLRAAQKDGFPLSGEHKLAAWVRLDARDPDAIRSCIGLFYAVYVGAELPVVAQKQKLWDASGITAGAYRPGSWGGHCMVAAKYDSTGPTFATWGGLQKATWAWWRTYVDEAYALLDAERALVAGVDFDALVGDIQALAAER